MLRNHSVVKEACGELLNNSTIQLTNLNGIIIKMALTRNDFMPLVIDALKANHGKAHLTIVTQHIWNNHHANILASPKFCTRGNMTYDGPQILFDVRVR